jgi:hypothetical protein
LLIEGSLEVQATTYIDTLRVQPGTDSTTNVQFLDADGGTPILNIDSTNEGVQIGGYLDVQEIDTPSTPATNNLRLYAEAIQGFSFFTYLDDTGMKRHLLRDSMILAYNDSGSTIAASRIVYASGSSSNVPTIALAKANALATMPAIGVTIESIANGAFGRVMQVGILENVNTAALAEGNVLYVSAATGGVPTTTIPVTPNLIQEIGTVLVSNASTGAIQIVARSVRGDEYGTIQNAFSIGDGAAGSKTLTFNAASDTSLVWNETNLSISSPVVAPSLTVTNACVLGSNSAVFQPNADSTTFFQVLDADGGTPILNVDTTNLRVGINVADPTYELDISGAGSNTIRVSNNSGNSRILFRYSDGNGGNCQIFDDSNNQNVFIRGYGISYFNAGNIGFGVTDPETLLEMEGTAPYLTLHNSTEEDTDGGRESRINFKGEQSGTEETTLARIEVSHDGAADDEKGKIVISTNDGSDGDTPTTALTIDSNQDATFVGRVLATTDGISTKKSTNDVADPPTDAELDTAFGDPTAIGSGFIGILDDNDAGTDCYICWTTGTAGEWFYTKGTKAV